MYLCMYYIVEAHADSGERSLRCVGVKKPLQLGGTFPAKHVNGSTSHTSALHLLVLVRASSSEPKEAPW